MQFLKDIYYQYWKKWGCFGNYPDWQTATKDCSGYDEAGIFEKVSQAALQVKEGKAKYERDSVLFNDETIHENLINRLKQVCDTEGVVRVLDFGGSLGSLYFQHKKIVESMPNMIWCVVEQGHFVEFGKEKLTDDILKFEYLVESAVKRYKPNFLLISSVLQYLEYPHEILDMLLATKIPYIFIDRTPFMNIQNDRIVKQIVPAYIYKASYPAWIFSKSKFLQYIDNKIVILDGFVNADKNNIENCRYEGFFLKTI